MARHVLYIAQPHRRLQVNKQHPENNSGGADALVRVPDVLDPDVGAGSKEEPMDRDEEEAQHVRRECDAHEEYRKGQALVFEGVIDRA